jgi:tetratricopeptide (TPR) repeat protein
MNKSILILLFFVSINCLGKGTNDITIELRLLGPNPGSNEILQLFGKDEFNRQSNTRNIFFDNKKATVELNFPADPGRFINLFCTNPNWTLNVQKIKLFKSEYHYTVTIYSKNLTHSTVYKEYHNLINQKQTAINSKSNYLTAKLSARFDTLLNSLNRLLDSSPNLTRNIETNENLNAEKIAKQNFDFAKGKFKVLILPFQSYYDEHPLNISTLLFDDLTNLNNTEDSLDIYVYQISSKYRLDPNFTNDSCNAILERTGASLVVFGKYYLDNNSKQINLTMGWVTSLKTQLSRFGSETDYKFWQHFFHLQLTSIKDILAGKGFVELHMPAYLVKSFSFLSQAYKVSSDEREPFYLKALKYCNSGLVLSKTGADSLIFLDLKLYLMSLSKSLRDSSFLVLNELISIVPNDIVYRAKRGDIAYYKRNYQQALEDYMIVYDLDSMKIANKSQQRTYYVGTKEKINVCRIALGQSQMVLEKLKNDTTYHSLSFIIHYYEAFRNCDSLIKYGDYCLKSKIAYPNPMYQYTYNRYHRISFLIGESYFYNKNYEKALEYYKTVLALDKPFVGHNYYSKKFSDLKYDIVFPEFFKLARCYEHLNKIDSAILYYTLPNQGDPRDNQEFFNQMKTISQLYCLQTYYNAGMYDSASNLITSVTKRETINLVDDNGNVTKSLPKSVWLNAILNLKRKHYLQIPKELVAYYSDSFNFIGINLLLGLAYFYSNNDSARFFLTLEEKYIDESIKYEKRRLKSGSKESTEVGNLLTRLSEEKNYLSKLLKGSKDNKTEDPFTNFQSFYLSPGDGITLNLPKINDWDPWKSDGFLLLHFNFSKSILETPFFTIDPIDRLMNEADESQRGIYF